VSKASEETVVRIKKNVRPESVTPAQREAWRKFWRKLIAEVKDDERK